MIDAPLTTGRIGHPGQRCTPAYVHERIGARQPLRAGGDGRQTSAVVAEPYMASSLMLIIGSRIETMIPAINSAMMMVIAGTSSVSIRWMLR